MLLRMVLLIGGVILAFNFVKKKMEKEQTQLPKFSRITSVEQALKSKWVTKEAKALIRLYKRFPEKMGSGLSVHGKLLKTLKTKDVRAIKTQMLDIGTRSERKILVFEKEPSFKTYVKI